ncbi:NUDIX hydrolase [Geodermatophilaceae bacterium NBWT11]|nr:NUDIX hydrolase [Geodermatophilaceae bacterium NBWT11]
MHLDSAGKALTDYERPSLAVDTAVLTVPPDSSTLDVLVVRSDDGTWRLPGTFLHEGERLADAVQRSLRVKVGLRGRDPEQLRVFDDPARDSRGWVLSVAHVDVVPWAELAPVLERRPDDVTHRPCDEVRGLAFDHDAIVMLAAEHVRAGYRADPDPAGLVTEPFTLRELRLVHEAVLGRLPRSADTFRRAMLPSLDEVSGEVREGTVGKPAQLYRRRPAR